MYEEARAGFWDPDLVNEFFSMLDTQKRVA
jgi:hypothetical protein